MVLAPFKKWNSFNKSRKDGKVVIDLVDPMLNTIWALEVANVFQLFTSTWKYFHTKWSPNIIQLFMFEAIMKYVLQGLECVKQEINPICAKFHIFPYIIKGVQFPERSKYYFSQF